MVNPCLTGIRVLDLTRALAGPYCTRMLSDLGAEVIKVEPPPQGDSGRRNPHSRPDGYNGFMMFANRGKLSLGINLKTGRGLYLVRQLAAVCDVVVENFRPGVMERIGLGFEALQQLNPSIILCSISGYGASGPYTSLPGQDMGGQAISGVLDLTGPPEGPPVVPNISLADSHAGIHGAVAVLAALVERLETGCGQHIDMAISDAAFWLHDTGVQETLAGVPPRRSGAFHPSLVPRGVFRVGGGWLAIDAWVQDNWRRLTEAMGRPDLGRDPRFATPAARARNREPVLKLVEEWLGTFQDPFVASKVLSRAGVPAEPVSAIPETVHHTQVQARQLLARTRDPAIGEIPVQRVPFAPVDEEGFTTGIYPRYGAATLPILVEVLGYSREAVARMYFDDVIQADEQGAPELLALLEQAGFSNG